MPVANGLVDIEQLASGAFDNGKVQIVIPGGAGGGVVTGFTQDAFTMAGGANFEGKQPGHFQTADSLISTASRMMNSAGAGFDQITTLSRASTIRRWVTSENAQFPVNFTIVAYKSGIDVRKPVAKLFACVYPAGAGTSLGGYEVAMRGPMGYQPDIDSAENTATLVIGKWFKADGLLIDDVQASFSREVTTDGTPLYADVSVTLSPYRMLFAGDIAGFIGG